MVLIFTTQHGQVCSKDFFKRGAVLNATFFKCSFCTDHRPNIYHGKHIKFATQPCLSYAPDSHLYLSRIHYCIRITRREFCNKKCYLPQYSPHHFQLIVNTYLHSWCPSSQCYRYMCMRAFHHLNILHSHMGLENTGQHSL